MPPVQALAALHGLWFLVIVPLTWWLVRGLPPQRLCWVGAALVGVGLLGVDMVVFHEVTVWLPHASDSCRRYLPQRILFALATFVDYPILQVTTAGVVCWLGGKVRQRRGRRDTGVSASGSRPDDQGHIQVEGAPLGHTSSRS